MTAQVRQAQFLVLRHASIEEVGKNQLSPDVEPLGWALANQTLDVIEAVVLEAQHISARRGVRTPACSFAVASARTARSHGGGGAASGYDSARQGHVDPQVQVLLGAAHLQHDVVVVHAREGLRAVDPFPVKEQRRRVAQLSRRRQEGPGAFEPEVAVPAPPFWSHARTPCADPPDLPLSRLRTW